MLSLSYTFFEAVFCNSLFEDSTIFFFLQVRGKRVPQSKSSIKRAIEDSSFACENIFQAYFVFTPKICFNRVDFKILNIRAL